MARRDEFIQVAQTVPYDNTTSGIPETDVQGAIDYAISTGVASATPSYTFTRSGNIPENTFLYNGTVPSNRTGVPVMTLGAKIERMAVGTEDLNSYTVNIYTHNGDEINLALVHTQVVSSTRSAQYSVPSIDIPIGKQVAISITNGSAKNISVSLIIKGTIA